MIPLATTTVTFRRLTSAEPYEQAATTVLATAVPAHISSPSGAERLAAGSQERIDATLHAAPTAGIGQGDQAVDDQTGVVYRVVWATPRQGLGLDHLTAGLAHVDGAVPS